jgi:hypothetical protein
MNWLTRKGRRRWLLRAVVGVALFGPAIFDAALAANGSVTYTYDALGRLRTALYDTGVCTYQYDANGNRTQQTVNVSGSPLTPTWGTGILLHVVDIVTPSWTNLLTAMQQYGAGNSNSSIFIELKGARPIFSTGSAPSTRLDSTILNVQQQSSDHVVSKTMMSEGLVRKAQRKRVGNYLSIPLGDGKFAFGRELKETVAFYDKQSDCVLPVESLANIPIAFTLAVHDAAIKSGRWTIIGNQPLQPEFLYSPKFFREDPMTGTVDIYVDGAFRRRSNEDLSQLERLVVWSGERVEERLRNHFLGLLNPQTEKFKYKENYIKKP